MGLRRGSRGVRLSPAQVRALTPIDERSYNAAVLGANLAESYMPED